MTSASVPSACKRTTSSLPVTRRVLPDGEKNAEEAARLCANATRGVAPLSPRCTASLRTSHKHACRSLEAVARTLAFVGCWSTVPILREWRGIKVVLAEGARTSIMLR